MFFRPYLLDLRYDKIKVYTIGRYVFIVFGKFMSGPEKTARTSDKQIGR